MNNHVGGHSNKTWTDKGALCAIKREVNAQTFIDVGCGPGGQIEIAKLLGLKAYGIDGDINMAKKSTVQIVDFSKTKASIKNIENIPSCGMFDIGWSTEFLEHIEEKFTDNFMPVFAMCKFIVITHATPGQGGYHHVNEQPFEYWRALFERYNLRYNEKLTEIVKRESTMKTKKLNHFIGYDANGSPLNVKIKSSFMVKTGSVFENIELNEKIL